MDLMLIFSLTQSFDNIVNFKFDNINFFIIVNFLTLLFSLYGIFRNLYIYIKNDMYVENFILGTIDKLNPDYRKRKFNEFINTYDNFYDKIKHKKIFFFCGKDGNIEITNGKNYNIYPYFINYKKIVNKNCDEMVLSFNNFNIKSEDYKKSRINLYYDMIVGTSNYKKIKKWIKEIIYFNDNVGDWNNTNFSCSYESYDFEVELDSLDLDVVASLYQIMGNNTLFKDLVLNYIILTIEEEDFFKELRNWNSLNQNEILFYNYKDGTIEKEIINNNDIKIKIHDRYYLNIYTIDSNKAFIPSINYIHKFNCKDHRIDKFISDIKICKDNINETNSIVVNRRDNFFKKILNTNYLCHNINIIDISNIISCGNYKTSCTSNLNNNKMFVVSKNFKGFFYYDINNDSHNLNNLYKKYNININTIYDNNLKDNDYINIMIDETKANFCNHNIGTVIGNLKTNLTVANFEKLSITKKFWDELNINSNIDNILDIVFEEMCKLYNCSVNDLLSKYKPIDMKGNIYKKICRDREFIFGYPFKVLGINKKNLISNNLKNISRTIKLRVECNDRVDNNIEIFEGVNKIKNDIIKERNKENDILMENAKVIKKEKISDIKDEIDKNNKRICDIKNEIDNIENSRKDNLVEDEVKFIFKNIGYMNNSSVKIEAFNKYQKFDKIIHKISYLTGIEYDFLVESLGKENYDCCDDLDEEIEKIKMNIYKKISSQNNDNIESIKKEELSILIEKNNDLKLKEMDENIKIKNINEENKFIEKKERNILNIKIKTDELKKISKSIIELSINNISKSNEIDDLKTMEKLKNKINLNNLNMKKEKYNSIINKNQLKTIKKKIEKIKKDDEFFCELVNSNLNNNTFYNKINSYLNKFEIKYNIYDKTSRRKRSVNKNMNCKARNFLKKYSNKDVIETNSIIIGKNIVNCNLLIKLFDDILSIYRLDDNYSGNINILSIRRALLNNNFLSTYFGFSESVSKKLINKYTKLMINKLS